MQALVRNLSGDVFLKSLDQLSTFLPEHVLKRFCGLERLLTDQLSKVILDLSKRARGEQFLNVGLRSLRSVLQFALKIRFNISLPQYLLLDVQISGLIEPVTEPPETVPEFLRSGRQNFLEHLQGHLQLPCADTKIVDSLCVKAIFQLFSGRLQVMGKGANPLGGRKPRRRVLFEKGMLRHMN